MSLTAGLAVAGWGSCAALAAELGRRRTRDAADGEQLAAVAHELRGPLHAAGMILAAARREAGPAAGPALTALELELGRIALAAGDLAPSSVRRAPHDATCDVTALVAGLAPGWRTLIAEGGRELRVSVPDRPLWVGAERLRLAQAFGNLVANAAEHGAGTIDVRLSMAPKGGARVEVRDAGRGLPHSVAALVARHPAPGRARGRGLGIVAGIAADAGGRLWSAPAAAGARVVLELPPPARHNASPVSGGPLLAS